MLIFDGENDVVEIVTDFQNDPFSWNQNLAKRVSRLIERWSVVRMCFQRSQYYLERYLVNFGLHLGLKSPRQCLIPVGMAGRGQYLVSARKTRRLKYCVQFASFWLSIASAFELVVAAVELDPEQQ